MAVEKDEDDAGDGLLNERIESRDCGEKPEA